MDTLHRGDVVGSGGGGKDGGGGHTATEDSNTLRSKSFAEILELLGEGEIVGLVDGGKSIFLNDTPLIASDGSENFKGVTWEQRVGLPNQDPIPGFQSAASETEVGVKVTKSGGPITRTISEADADACRVTVHTPNLSTIDTATGDMHGGKIEFTIQVRPNAGAWVTAIAGTIEGKTTSGYSKTYRFDLPKAGAPWEVRLERTSADSTASSANSDLYWQSYTLITLGRFNYRHSALLGVRVDAEQFGTAIPNRSYEVKGRLIRVPTNYNPLTRTYTGIWDGAWKLAWTDNPAWVFLDLLLAKRFGLGDFISEPQVDKWGLYQIARYCDAVGPTGAFVGVSDGQGGTMPRFTYNGCLQTKEEAYKVLQQIASCFRGLVYWGSGQVVPRADMPADPKKLVTQANVIDGSFVYSSTALKARHTVAVVSWNDPADGYRPTPVVVEDRAGLLRYGYNPIEVTAPGCTNRRQAQRFGKWILESEQRETETVTYRCSWDHLDVMPGDVVAVADPAFAGWRAGGRVAGIAGQSVTLDAAPALDAEHTYTLSLTLADGSIAEHPITGWAGDAVTVSGAIGATVAGAVFVITASNLKPRPFRVMAVSEPEANVFEVVGLFHDPGKFARVDLGQDFEEEPYQLQPDVLQPPDGLEAVESVTWINGLPSSKITVSWRPSQEPTVIRYAAQVLPPAGVWQTWAVGNQTTFDINPALEGEYVVRVACTSTKGVTSRWAEVRVAAQGKGTPPGKPTALAAVGGIRQISLTWANPSDSDLAHVEIHESATNDLATAVKVGESKSTSFIHAGLGGLEWHYYWVRAVDLSGNIGDFNSNVGTGAQTELSEVSDIGESIRRAWFMDLVQKIDRIDFSFLDERITSVVANGSLAETVNRALTLSADHFERLKAERGVSDSKFAAVNIQVTDLLEADQSLAAQITTVATQFDANKAVVLEKLSALTTADSATATRLDALQAQVDEDIAAAIVTEQTARAAGDVATAQMVQVLRADFDGNKAAVASSLSALSAADSATATRLDTLVGRVAQAEAALSSETQARVNQDGVLLSQITQARAYTDQTISGYDSTIKNWVNGSSSLASSVQTLQSTVGGQSTQIQQAVNAIDGVRARYSVTVDNNGHVSGFDLLSKPVNGAPSSAFIIRADNFAIAIPGQANSQRIPFAMTTVNGQPMIGMDAKTWISDLSVNTLKIQNHAISQSFFAAGSPARVNAVFFGGLVHITASYWMAGASNHVVWLSLDGNRFWSASAYSPHLSISFVVQPSNSWHTIEAGADTPMNTCFMQILEVMR